MAHSVHTKAKALALLALGNTPRYVAGELQLPLTTVRRWQPEAHAMLRESLSEEDRQRIDVLVADVRAVFPGLFVRPKRP